MDFFVAKDFGIFDPTDDRGFYKGLQGCPRMLGCRGVEGFGLKVPRLLLCSALRVSDLLRPCSILPGSVSDVAQTSGPLCELQ